ncbi:MAG: hypothetical protein IJ201_06625 [Solobacterium sp.]|nr:hypothetical protein [Solobacterium sp.]
MMNSGEMDWIDIDEYGSGINLYGIGWIEYGIHSHRCGKAEDKTDSMKDAKKDSTATFAIIPG